MKCEKCGQELPKDKTSDKNTDPFLTIGAPLMIWDGNKLDRKLVWYKGEPIEYEHYYVLGTPWETVPKNIDEIEIADTGELSIGCCMYGCWKNKPDDFPPGIYKRPEWAK